MGRLILTRGIPASGKSEWSQQWVQAAPERRVRLNRDDLRASLFGARHGLTDRQEAFITRVQQDAARAALAKGHDVVVDGTNLNDKLVRDWFRIGPVEFVDFPVALATAILRDKARQHSVGEKVIRRFFKRTDRGNLRPAPTAPPTREYEPYVPDRSLPKAIVVDIDGTIARIPEGGRSPYDYTRVLEDDPVPYVVDHIFTLALRLGVRVIFLSGRDDSCRADTEAWLDAHTGIPFEALHMRASGDKRDDALIKHELFTEQIAPNFHVVAVFDDRLRVRRMWHHIGAPLFSVGDPDASF